MTLMENESKMKEFLQREISKVAHKTHAKGKYLYDKKLDFSTCQVCKQNKL